MTGKNILLVGSSSGIGLELAKILLERGATVYNASRRPSPLPRVNNLLLDVTSPTADALSGLPDELHGVVYCPGSINLKPFQRLTEADFEQDFRVNVLGAVRVIQASVRALKKSGNASVILFSTVAVQAGMSFHASVAAAKGAVEGLTRSLAAELAPSRIRVNAIAPSLTDTPLAGNLLSSDEKREASAKRHPLGRVGTPHDIAAMAAFLLSDDASWITGQILGVDGGLSSLKA